MVKVKAVLFSALQGKVKKAEFRKRKNRVIELSQKRIPFNPRTKKQQFVRRSYGKCVEEWNKLSESEKREWRIIGTLQGISGYNAFMRECLNKKLGAIWYEITIDNSANSNDLTDYQILLEIVNDATFFEDCQNEQKYLEFYDTDKATLLNHFVEEFDVTNKNAKIWIKVPSIPANSTKTIYLKINTSRTTDRSNGINTFEFFRDFNNNDISDWSQGCRCHTAFSNMPEVSNGIVYAPTETCGMHIPHSLSLHGFALKWKIKLADTDNSYMYFIISDDNKKGYCLHPSYRQSKFGFTKATGEDGSVYNTWLWAKSISDKTTEWQIIEGRRRSSDYKFELFVNDEQLTNPETDTADSEITAFTYVEVAFRMPNDSLDWMFIRKYSDPEPTVSYSKLLS